MRRISLALLLCFSACSEYDYTSLRRKDVFQQDHRNTVDILMVVDNSCSMVEEQDKMASNFESFITAFQGVDVDWQIGVVTTDTRNEEVRGRLVGGDDEIVFYGADGRAIDEIVWDRSWQIVEGVALQLDADYTSGSGNGDPDHWCLATQDYGLGDLGTPGEPNEVCGSPRPTARTAPPPPPADGDARAPRAGEVVITEFMADPRAASDEAGEWVELTSVADDPLDLSGCVLADDGRNAYTFPDDVVLAPGDALVVARSTDTAANGGVQADLASGADFTLNNPVAVLTPDTESADEIFSEMVAVGTSGSGIEMGLEGARLALSEPLVSTVNAGFLRDNANLSLIFISDEDDLSPLNIYEYLRFFTDLKGDTAYRDHSQLNVSAVVGSEEPPYEGVASCESDNGSATYGSRYVALAQETEGALESICDEDFSPIAAELGLTISGLVLSFELSEPADPRDMSVRLYADQSDDSLIAELVQDVDYRYDEAQNAIVFEIENIPPSDTWIVVEYRLLGGGTTLDEDGT